MKLEDANNIVTELLEFSKLGKHINFLDVCGSIRRKQPEVNDIDIVLIQKDEASYQFGDETLDETIKKLHMGEKEQLMAGDKIKRFFYKGISIDLYLATPTTYSTLRLIRTGSKEHNIRLTTIAKMRGQKLFANGGGLCKMNGDEVIYLIADKEDEILQSLLGRIPMPEERS